MVIVWLNPIYLVTLNLLIISLTPSIHLHVQYGGRLRSAEMGLGIQAIKQQSTATVSTAASGHVLLFQNDRLTSPNRLRTEI